MAYHLKVISASSTASMAAATTLVNTALAADLVTFGNQNVQANNICVDRNNVNAGYMISVTVQEAG